MFAQSFNVQARHGRQRQECLNQDCKNIAAVVDFAHATVRAIVILSGIIGIAIAAAAATTVFRQCEGCASNECHEQRHACTMIQRDHGAQRRRRRRRRRRAPYSLRTTVLVHLVHLVH
jgi:hypothetical protein